MRQCNVSPLNVIQCVSGGRGGGVITERSLFVQIISDLRLRNKISNLCVRARALANSRAPK